MTPIDWLPWAASAFARAHAERKPVLLSVAPAWCPFSREMDRTSFADPTVAALIGARFVPVRVDAERRPDVAARYALGGWPTTAFLTPDGEILGGGTFVEASRLADVLERVSSAFSAERHLHADRPVTRAAGAPARPSIEALIHQVVRSFDVVHGGIAGSPKFPHDAPVRLLLALYRETRDQALADLAITTLDAMGWGPLWDEQDGGFFRSSRDEDWGRPAEEKLLDTNARLLSLYVDALDTLHLARYGERAESVLRFVQSWLADPVDGGWAASHRAASHGETTPGIDPTLYSDANAVMAAAALHAGRILDDPGLSRFAIASLERVTLLNYRPGQGVAHYYDGAPQVRGLLDDQVATAAAQLDAFEATGNIVYRMMAEELALHAIRTMWDDSGGGFFDRAVEDDDVGLLREPVKPFATNCLAARTLQRLAGATGSSEFAGCAARTLAAMAAAAGAEGPHAAEYVLAVRDSGR